MKQTITETKEMAQKLASELKHMNEHELYHAWHIRCETMNYWDDEICEMDFFDEYFHGLKPLEIAMRVSFGDFNPHDEYFYFDGYGNPVSINYLSEIIHFEDFADEIMENDNLADAIVNAGLLEEWRDGDE